MANPNTGEWVEDLNTRKSDENIYAQLVKEYSKDKLSKKDDRSAYLQSLESADIAGAVNSEMITDIERFAGNSGKYDGITISPAEIKVQALKREAAWYFASLSNNRQAVKDMYLQEFDVTDSTLSSKIDTKLNTLSESELQDILSNEKRRKWFLEGEFWIENLPKEKSIANFLKEMNLEAKYKKVKPENEIQFYDIVQKIKHGQTLEDLDVEILLDSGAYTQKEKQELIQKLLPSITLAKAKQYGLIEIKHATDLKDSHIRSIDPGLHRWAVREISSSIQDEDILIATSKFTDLKQNADKIIDNPSIFNSFLDSYNTKITWYREEIDGKEIRRADDFKNILKDHPKVSWADNIMVGSIIQITQSQKGENWAVEDVKLFGKITKLSDDGTFEFTEKWNREFDAASTNVVTQNYNSFIWFLSDWNPQKSITSKGMQVFSEAEFDAKVTAWEIKEKNGDTLRLSSKSQIDADIASMTRDINGTEEALRAKEVQMRNDLSEERPKLTSDEIKQRIDADPWVQKYRESLEKLRWEQYEKTQTLDNLESSHFETLKTQINEIDKEGEKFGLKKGTVLKTKSGDIFTITEEPNFLTGDIHLTSVWDHQTVSFEDFYRAFKSKDTKRVGESAVDFGAMVDSIKSSSKDESSWKGFSFTNWKLKKENTKTQIRYDYLGSKDNNELIKIHDITGDRVNISFGQLTSVSQKDKNNDLKRGDNNKIIKDETFSLEKREYSVSLGFLEQYIKDNTLDPRGLNDNNEVPEDTAGIKPMDKRVHFWSALFYERATISDAIKWWTLFVEQMKEMIEKGGDEKANQFALKYMWAILTEDARRDMQSRLEQKQKKSMEDYLERLEWVASDVAVLMINQWLHDKFAPDYMHEAAAVFMLKKYWVLNAKWPLQKNEWKYVWYQALGWEIDDTFFKKVQSEKVADDLPFTEELLVYRLLKEQCWQKGFNGKKRRSKLHKEVKKHRAVGKEEEYETGKRDGADERTCEGRVEWGVGEMLSNNYPNMVWWLEVAVDKGWPMHLMNKIPFLAAFSGVAYNFEEKTTDQLKNFPAGTRLLMMLRFFSHHSDLDLLNKTILSISKTLEKKWHPKHAGMWQKAQALFDQMKSPWGWVKSKIKMAESFYDEYGEDLTNILYMLNTGKKDDTLSKLIFFEKDNTDNPESWVLKEYYTKLHGYVDADTSFEDEWLMSDPFRWAGTSGIEMHKFAEQQIGTTHGKFKKHASWPMSWDEIQHEFEAIPHRQYDPNDPVKNKKMQMDLLSDNLQRMISGIILSVGTNETELAAYNAALGPFNKLNKWWIDMTRFWETSDFSVHGLLHAKWDVRGLIESFAEQIIQTETTGTNFSHKIVNKFASEEWWSWAMTGSTIADSISWTKTKVAEATDRSSKRSKGLDPEY
jgi:hypothetical protein